MFAGTEWGVKLVQSDTQFNLSASESGDFGVVENEDRSVFNARLGFIGVDFGPGGRVAIGKQGSTHYDITSYTTDRFNVFGGQGTSTYVAGTDGGVTGTGRADRVADLPEHDFQDPRGRVPGTVPRRRRQRHRRVGQVTVLPGVKVGGTVTHTNWPQATKDLVHGLTGNADYSAFGTKITWDMLDIGFVYSHQSNGDMVQVPIGAVSTPVAFDADGTELYLRAGLGPFGLIGGFTYQNPDVKDPLVDPDFNTKYAILGGEWFVSEKAKVYTESKLDLGSVSPSGADGGNVFTIGFRYDFLYRISHR